MPRTRVKFLVTSKESKKYTGREGDRLVKAVLNSVRLEPVHLDIDNGFFKYPRAASLTLEMLSDAAAAKFTKGKEYFLDFTPVPSRRRS